MLKKIILSRHLDDANADIEQQVSQTATQQLTTLGGQLQTTTIRDGSVRSKTQRERTSADVESKMKRIEIKTDVVEQTTTTDAENRWSNLWMGGALVAPVSLVGEDDWGNVATADRYAWRPDSTADRDAPDDGGSNALPGKNFVFCIVSTGI